MSERVVVGGAAKVAPPGPQGNGSAEGSILSQLRVAAAAQQEEHIMDFMVGGEFRKQLWIRYKPLDPGPMDRFISRRAQVRELQEKNPKADFPITELNMDLMAQACVAVLGADADGGNKEVLEDNLGLVRLEKRLAILLGMPVPPEAELTSREVILMIFGGNGMAIIDHGDSIVTWMSDPASYSDPGKS